jgi:hypothetical protein
MGLVGVGDVHHEDSIHEHMDVVLYEVGALLVR